jgi:hypothetical protein
MKDVTINFRHLDLSIGLVPAADKVDTNMAGARDDQEPEQLAVLDISFDTVKDILCEINKEEYVEDLLDRVLEKRKNQKQFIRLPNLFQCIFQLFERTWFFPHVFSPPK